MDLFKESWVTTDMLEGREREVMFILFETAGFRVHQELRWYLSTQSSHLCGFGDIGAFRIDPNVFRVDPYYIKQGFLLYDTPIKHYLTKEELQQYLVNMITNITL